MLYAESAADPTDHFTDAFFPKMLRTAMTLWRRYAVQKFTVDSILFREIHRKKMDILMFWQRFQCKFHWSKVKYARITITHVSFIALTLAGSLGRCLNTPPIVLMFKHLPLDTANVNAWKKCVIPLLHIASNCLFISKNSHWSYKQWRPWYKQYVLCCLLSIKISKAILNENYIIFLTVNKLLYHKHLF